MFHLVSLNIWPSSRVHISAIDIFPLDGFSFNFISICIKLWIVYLRFSVDDTQRTTNQGTIMTFLRRVIIQSLQWHSVLNERRFLRSLDICIIYNTWNWKSYLWSTEQMKNSPREWRDVIKWNFSCCKMVSLEDGQCAKATWVNRNFRSKQI